MADFGSILSFRAAFNPSLPILVPVSWLSRLPVLLKSLIADRSLRKRTNILGRLLQIQFEANLVSVLALCPDVFLRNHFDIVVQK